MNKKIIIRFEKGSNEEFAGGDCVGKYESYIANKLSEALGTEVELTNDSPMGTKVEGDWDSPQEEQEVNDIVYDVLTRAGNNLAEICKS